MTSAETIDYRSLAHGSRIDVETRSRHYQIECVGGSAILISGHPEFCPTPIKAHLQGSVDPEGTLDPGVIGRGMRLMLVFDNGRLMTTSRVLSVHVEPTSGLRANSSLSIH